MKQEIANGCLHPASLQNAARFLKIAKDAERKNADHHAALSRHFATPNRNHQSAREAMRTLNIQHAMKREAVAKMVDIIYAFAAAVLQSPADYPAHMIDYAHGLIAESTDYVNKERGTQAWASP